MNLSLNRSTSSKQRSKALSFGDLSKKVFDLSCSNASPPAAIEKPSANGGQQNCQDADSKGVSDVDARQESQPATQTKECGITQLPEDDHPETPETAKCIGISPFHYPLQCRSPRNSSKRKKNGGLVRALESIYSISCWSCQVLPNTLFLFKSIYVS